MSTVELLATAIRSSTGPLRPIGSGSRADWGGPDPTRVRDISTLELNRIVEHNPGDFTAVLEAGVGLAQAQATFAAHGQWLALDPPDPGGTIGGLFASADSGPARHRYGGPRDLIIGATVVLSDGTVATSGGRVIKNVAGYDLGKLFTGSRGTLGLLAAVAVRLHPLPARTATLTAPTDDAAALGSAVVRLARRPIEAMCLDAWWDGSSGGLLVRFGGAAAPDQARRVASLLDIASTVEDDDDQLWAEQRRRQRGAVVLKVSHRLTDLPVVVDVARRHGASLVARAGLGLSWLRFPSPDGVVGARSALAPRHCLVLDGAALVPDPDPVRADPARAALNERVKARFDPLRRFRPGAFGGL